MLARSLWILNLIRLIAVGLIAAWLVDRAGFSLAAAIAVGLAVLLSIHAVVLGTQFALARWHASPEPAGRRLGMLGHLRLYAEELYRSVLAYTLILPLFGSRTLASAASPGAADRLPVLFLHGFMCNRSVWRPMARALARQGHVTTSVNLEPLFGSIDGYIDVIEQGIRELQQRTGEEQVALVCHSMGGIAARAYLRARGIEDIARVVTIGSPHRGTAHARFGLSPNIVQLRRDGPWLTELARTEWPSVRRLFTVILSHHDNIIAPQAIQTLPEARTIELTGVTHLAMLSRTDVHALVSEALRR